MLKSKTLSQPWISESFAPSSNISLIQEERQDDSAIFFATDIGASVGFRYRSAFARRPPGQSGERAEVGTVGTRQRRDFDLA